MSLTKCQQNGLFQIQFAKKHVIIMGPAGTGKTYLLREVLELLMKSCNGGIAFCAPTHQAKKVLQEMINSGKNEMDWVKAHTVHSLLKIHPDTYEDEVVFDNKGEVPEFEDIKYIVVDEISMIDAPIYDKLMTVAKKNNISIIGVGDPYQIQPVNSEGSYIHPTLGPVSLLFKLHDSFTRVVLEEIVRQSEGHPIIEVATNIRKRNCDFYELIAEDGKTGVFKLQSDAELVAKYLEYVKTPEDTLKYKLMAYTNAKVEEMNAIVREHIFKTKAPYAVGEYLVMQEPVYDRSGKMSKLIFNNGQVCEVVNIEGGSFVQEQFELPDLVHDVYVPNEDPNELDDFVKGVKVDPLSIEVWKLDVRSIDDEMEYTIYSIKDEEANIKYQEYMSLSAEIYKEIGRGIDAKLKFYYADSKANPMDRQKNNFKINELRTEKRDMWAGFWALKSKFIDVKGSAACTFHKSQGSTFIGAFISSEKLEYCEYHLARQLRYVGITRARDFVYFS